MEVFEEADPIKSDEGNEIPIYLLSNTTPTEKEMEILKVRIIDTTIFSIFLKKLHTFNILKYPRTKAIDDEIFYFFFLVGGDFIKQLGGEL